MAKGPKTPGPKQTESKGSTKVEGSVAIRKAKANPGR